MKHAETDKKMHLIYKHIPVQTDGERVYYSINDVEKIGSPF